MLAVCPTSMGSTTPWVTTSANSMALSGITSEDPAIRSSPLPWWSVQLISDVNKWAASLSHWQWQDLKRLLWDIEATRWRQIKVSCNGWTVMFLLQIRELEWRKAIRLKIHCYTTMFFFTRANPFLLHSYSWLNSCEAYSLKHSVMTLMASERGSSMWYDVIPKSDSGTALDVPEE